MECPSSPNFLQILTLNLLTTTIVVPPSNASKWQMGFNSAFKGLINIYKPVPVLFAFWPVGDAMTDISPPVRLYRKMCMVKVNG
jgi:hypothetical protein